MCLETSWRGEEVVTPKKEGSLCTYWRRAVSQTENSRIAFKADNCWPWYFAMRFHDLRWCSFHVHWKQSISGGEAENVDAVEFKWLLVVFSRYLFVTSERQKNSGEVNTGLVGRAGSGWEAEVGNHHWWLDCCFFLLRTCRQSSDPRQLADGLS